jgi:hypothetical protein
LASKKYFDNQFSRLEDIMEIFKQKKHLKTFEKMFEKMFKYAINTSTMKMISDLDQKKRVIEGTIKDLIIKYINSELKNDLNINEDHLYDDFIERMKLELFDLFEQKKEKLYIKYKKHFTE